MRFSVYQRSLSALFYHPKHLLIGLWMTFLLGITLAPYSLQANTSTQDLAQRVRTLLESRCFQCHGKNGRANKNIFILNRRNLIDSKTLVPGDETSLLLKVVEAGSMPLGGPELSESDKVILHKWVVAGAPDWDTESVTTRRAFFSESTILNLIEQDLEKSRDRTRPFLRYFSLAHLYNSGLSDEELEQARTALAKLLNSLSFHREISIPQPIDSSKIILRIDLRDYNWTPQTWNAVLAVYPYGLRTPGSDSINRLSSVDIPYVRADWFVATASLPPLYHDLLGLPKTLQELERTLGVNVAQNLEQEKNVVRAAIRNSGISQNNRVVERHVSQYGAYWRSYDFKSSLGNQNIFKDPIHLRPDGGEVIFNLPNGLQAYFVVDAFGRRLDAAPIEIVSDRNTPDDPIIRNGFSCISCHYAGMKTFKDDLREVIKAQYTTDFDREKTLELFPPQSTFDQLLQQDSDQFRRAIEKTGGKIGTGVQSEPVYALSRRYKADLTIAAAAAETGLEPQEFQARVRGSSRLQALGFGQLLVANGGFKREIWEKQFRDIVRELNLGEFAQGGKIAPAFNFAGNASLTAGNNPADFLRLAQTLFVSSKTKFFKPDLLTIELQQRPDFQTSQLLFVKDKQAADLEIEIDRPFLTFTYTFTVTNPQTKIVVAAGEIEAENEISAAPKLAREFAKKLQVRANSNQGNPGSPVARFDVAELVRTSQKIFITTRTQFFVPNLMEVEFGQQPNFQALQFVVTKDGPTADLILEVDRPVLTFIYTYTVTHRATNVVVASGQFEAFDETFAASKLAKVFPQQMLKLRSQEQPKGK